MCIQSNVAQLPVNHFKLFKVYFGAITVAMYILFQFLHDHVFNRSGMHSKVFIFI